MYYTNIGHVASPSRVHYHSSILWARTREGGQLLLHVLSAASTVEESQELAPEARICSEDVSLLLMMSYW